MDRKIVIRLVSGVTVLLAVGALLVAVAGVSLLAGSTRLPAPLPRPAVGMLVTSREGVVSVARPDGTGPRRISPEGMLLRGPRWSTDGTHIAAWGGPIPSTSSIHPGDVYVMDADGGEIRSITPGLEPIFGDALAWSPDNRRIAIASEGRLFVADTDGGRAIELQVALIPADMLRTAAMSWSPDGNQLAVVVPRVGFPNEGVLEVVDVRTGEVTVVPTAGSLGYPSIGQASWSPTGDEITYAVTLRLAGDSGTGQHLMVAVRNGGAWTTSVLVRGPVSDPQRFGWPAWSNDGTRLAWVQGDLFGALALWVRSADGSAAHKLADLPVSELGQLGELAWLPDDSRIVVPNVPESLVSFLLVDPNGVASALSLDHLGGAPDWQTVAR